MISRKVSYSLEMRKLMCIPLHTLYDSKLIKLTASWLKFPALPRKHRKRLYDVENFTCKFVLMRLPAFGSHVASRNQGSFSEQDREPWERGCFCETCRVDKE